MLEEEVEYASKAGSVMKNTYEQFIKLPRALVDPDESPNKGQKSNSAKVYEKRYSSSTFIMSTLLSGWNPDSVVMEGSF